MNESYVEIYRSLSLQMFQDIVEIGNLRKRMFLHRKHCVLCKKEPCIWFNMLHDNVRTREKELMHRKSQLQELQSVSDYSPKYVLDSTNVIANV